MRFNFWFETYLIVVVNYSICLIFLPSRDLIFPYVSHPTSDRTQVPGAAKERIGMDDHPEQRVVLSSLKHAPLRSDQILSISFDTIWGGRTEDISGEKSLNGRRTKKSAPKRTDGTENKNDYVQ